MARKINLMKNKKIRISLGVKLTVLVILSCLIIFAVLAYFIADQQIKVLETSFRQQAINTTQALNASLTNLEDFVNQKKLQNTIYKLMWLNPEVAKININFLTKKGLSIIASSDTTSIGKIPSANNLLALKEDQTIVRKGKVEGVNSIWVLSPIRISGKLVGTYEVNLSLEGLEKEVSHTKTQLLLTILGGIIIITLFIVYFLKKELIRPINGLKRGMEIFGKGNLDHRIQAQRNDELGDLASGFNNMATKLQQTYQALKKSRETLEEKVKERTQQLEEAKTSLEIKVRARTEELRELAEGLEEKVKRRTKELQKKTEEVMAKSNELKNKVAELERMNKLMVGRELKMVELKKKIEELENKNSSTV